MFKVTNIDLGTIKVGSEHSIEFEYDGIYQMKDVVSPCECTSVTHDVGNKKIITYYKAKDIPVHLKMEGINEVNKQLTINATYIDNYGFERTEGLTFTAKVIE